MAKGPYRQIEKIETQEKSGYGAWRKEFCGNYPELLQTLSDCAALEKLAATRGRITCRKGCAIAISTIFRRWRTAS